jgi:hypothetical protein
LILISLWRDVGRFGEWSTLPFAAMMLPLLGRGWMRINAREWIVALVLFLMLTGYYVVYLLTDWDLASHLDSSLVRLLLQLWPGTIFFWCLAVTYGVPASGFITGGTSFGRRTYAAILLLNLAVASGVLIIFARQLPANQLAAARIAGVDANIYLGPGWFGRESHGRDVWAWSTGESTLLLRLSGGESRTATLRFSIRGLGGRTVTASIAGSVVWRASVPEHITVAEITGVRLQPGTTEIIFQSDTPGVPESDDASARKLTFALYNPAIMGY